MLTRSGVAKRLGKSLATVRRMEGFELHPRKNQAGVHLFDPAEVDRVARGETNRDHSHRLSDLTQRGIIEEGEDEDGMSADEYEELLEEYEIDAARERKLRREAEQALCDERQARERAGALANQQVREALHRAEQADRDATAFQIVTFLDSLSDRDLAALDDDDRKELMGLLREATEEDL